MFCRPRPSCILPAVVHPTKCCVNHTFSDPIVPHIHPVHTTTVNHVNYQHKHYFPKSQSAVTNVTHQHFKCGDDSCPMPMGPGAGFGPGPGFGAGMGPGAGYGPGMTPGMGMGPGMAPGMTPGMGMGPGMAPGMTPGMGMAPGMYPGMGR